MITKPSPETFRDRARFDLERMEYDELSAIFDAETRNGPGHNGWYLLDEFATWAQKRGQRATVNAIKEWLIEQLPDSYIEDRAHDLELNWDPQESEPHDPEDRR